MLLYICNGLTSNDPLVGDACGVIDDNVAQCRDGVLLGAWAVGGTVSAFKILWFIALHK